MNTDNRRGKYFTIYLGIFEVVGNHSRSHGHSVKFIDRFDICKYFPGYMRNKEQWESYRNTNLDHNTFKQIINGFLKFNKTMKDY